VFEALFRQDFDGWIGAFDENIVYIPTKEWFVATPRRGREVLLTFIKGIWEDWSQWDMTIRDVRGNGDRVLVETRVNAVGAKSGIELRGRTFHVATFHAGLITHLQDFIVEDEALAAVGLSA
jgi:ketosteroid isomerase-like protein